MIQLIITLKIIPKTLVQLTIISRFLAIILQFFDLAPYKVYSISGAFVPTTKHSPRVWLAKDFGYIWASAFDYGNVAFEAVIALACGNFACEQY